MVSSPEWRVSFPEWLEIVKATNDAYANAQNDAQRSAAVQRREEAAAAHQREIERVRNLPPSPPPPPSPAPLAAPSPRPAPTPEPPKPKIVKSPNRDVIDFSREQFSQSSITRLLFEQVGSVELVNIARRDTIEGQNPYYTLISNLSSINKNFDPTSLISRQKSNQNITDNYTINLNNKIPDQEYLDRNNITEFYYIDDNGDLVIELDNLASDEIIDFEIAESGTINLVDEA